MSEEFVETSFLVIGEENGIFSFVIWVGADADPDSWKEIDFEIIDPAIRMAKITFSNGAQMQATLEPRVEVGKRYIFNLSLTRTVRRLKTPQVRMIQRIVEGGN